MSPDGAREANHTDRPGIDGLEVLKGMKELGCEVPMIIVSGKGTLDVAIKAFRFGVKDYITKPFKVEELRATIRRVLGPSEVKKSPADLAVEFMEEHYHEPISARDVAHGVGVSYTHLAHLFKEVKRCAITDWLNKLRIEKAKVLLKNPNLEVKEVAAKVGFNDSNYFCRFFKKYTGTTPIEYRQQ